MVGQFLPALVAGAMVTGALVRLSPALAALLPGLWALFFGVGIFAARPYVPRASGWVALYYWTAGLLLLWVSHGADMLSPVGGRRHVRGRTMPGGGRALLESRTRLEP